MSLEVTGSYRFLKPDPPWLARTCEAIIDPDLPIIDAHHHIWEQDGHPYLLDDLLADTGCGHRIVGTIYVQAHYAYRTQGPEDLRCVGETERIEQIAQEAAVRGHPGICAGIVAFADMMRGSRAGMVLDAHQEAAPSRFRGIRHLVSHDPAFPNGIIMKPAQPGLLGDAAFRAGLAEVAARGLSFDAMLYHRQIPELTAVARALPGLPIMLNHFGSVLGVGPFAEARQETFAAWRKDLAALASCPNVHVKLGGMGMVICGGRWNEQPTPPGSLALAEDWRPYVETCFELFGIERCMFESNFPVDKGMFSYPVLWNAFKRLAEPLTPAEKSALFYGNARRFYRLEHIAAATTNAPLTA